MKKFHINRSTHIHAEQSTNQLVQHYMIALLPLVLFAFFKNGVFPYTKGLSGVYDLFLPLIVIGVSILGAFLSELGYLWIKQKIKKEPFSFSLFFKHTYFYLPAIILALLLPLHTPLYLVLFSSVIATLIGKMAFGGFGKNTFHPSLIGYVFVMILFGSVIASNGGSFSALEASNGFTQTPMEMMLATDGIGNYPTFVAPFSRMLNFVIGMVPGGLGTTSAILCLLGFIYLVVNRAIKWKIPVFYIGTVFVISYMIGAYQGLGLWYSFYQVMIGGLMFGAIYVAADTVTSPTTPIGQILYGITLGILTVVFRFLFPIELGVALSILLLNAFVFAFDMIGSRARFQFSVAMLPFCIAWTCILLLGVYIGTTYPSTPIPTLEEETTESSTEEEKVTTEYQIVSDQIQAPYHIYDVLDSTSSGNYTLQIYTLDHMISSIALTSHTETEETYQAFVNSNYLGQIIVNQAHLDQLQPIPNMELSSAIKDTVQQFYQALQQT